MKKKLALCAVLMCCVLCAMVSKPHTAKDSGSASEVDEITFKGSDSPEPHLPTESPGDGKGDDSPTLEPAEPTQAGAGVTGKSNKEQDYEKIISKAKIKSFGGTVQVGESGYELYNYVKDYARKYASTVSDVAAKLKGTSEVYDIVVPTSIGITLPDNKVKQVNSSDQEKAVKSIYHMLGKNVTGVSVYDILMQHRTEYLYFRTDHHWTQKGAYYTYQEFCREKGIEAHELSEYYTENFGPYLGSFYLDTNKSKELRIDKVRAYYPVNNKHIQMLYKDEHGGNYHSSVICDGSNYGTSLKYCAFIAGDNPYTVIKNKKVKDGSTCVVVKESFANVFVPFLADHYQKIYVIDYRYWKGSVSALAKKEKAQDVIFLNNISMTRNAYLLGKLAQVK